MSVGRRLVAALSVVGLASLATVSWAGLPASAADASSGITDSAVTVSGTGPFADLKVTVGQTKNLINQAVSVTWTGGTPTAPQAGRFGINYLQIMQCWSDDPTGPKREQCQFGGLLGDGRGGSQSASRQVSYGSTLVDPLETYVQEPGSFANVYVPFESVTGKATTGSRSEFFDASSTNEIPYARTRSDRGGAEILEMQTALEAPGLGCGSDRVGTVGASRGCWLVVVPRSTLEVDGSERIGSSAFSLDSSPLSATNWSQRLIIPLTFEPLAASCSFGTERKIAGQELVVEAVSRWQPALCTGGGATYSFSQVSDSLARRQLASPDPGLVMTARPVAPAAVVPTRPLVYAPVAVTGLTVAFLIERQSTSAAAEDVARDGTRVIDLKLTPRIVAKLLTESYRGATPDGNPETAANPQTVTADPDFVALNPEFAKLGYTTPSDALVPLGDSDATTLLWTWIDSDKDARAWLNGKADPWGMRVNPAYEKAVLPFENFPKSDPHCAAYPDDERLDLCTLERRPYAADFHEAARSAARGDALTRETWDPVSSPPAWKKSEPQFAGTRAVLAITDTATAERFGLQTARLRNASGAFVAPTSTSLAAALSVMRPNAASTVLEPNVTTTKASAYPLTVVTYAATAPAALTVAEGKDYANFLRYAAGKGQKPGVAPGELPAGYLPLTSALSAQTQAVASQIAAEAGKPVSVPAPTQASSGDPSGGDSSGSGGAAGGGSADPSASATPSPSGSSVAAPRTTAVVSLTPDDPVGRARFALVVVLVLGSVAALTGLVLLRISAKAP